MATPGVNNSGRDDIPVLPDNDLLRVAKDSGASTEDFLGQLDDLAVGVRRELLEQGAQIDDINTRIVSATSSVPSSETPEAPQAESIFKRMFRGGGSSAAEKKTTRTVEKEVISGGSSNEPTEKPAPSPVIKPKGPKLEHILGGRNNPEREKLLELLGSGNVQEFNRIRPSGCIDFRGIDLSGFKLEGVDFRNVDLSRASLGGTNLKNALFQNAIVDRAEFGKSTLTGAQFFNASARYADFRDVVNASGAVFQKAVLRSADLSGGNFSGADFTDAIMITATCTNARFKGPSTHMERACLAGAVLSGASFEGANLLQARLFQANGEDVDFSSANLTDAEAVQSHFTSSGNKSVASGKLLHTSFSGAWVRGFVHNGAIPTELLKGSINDKTPPEGMFQEAKEADPGKILINGVPGTDKVLYDAAMLDLNELVGMHEAKKKVRELTYFVEASQTRQGFGLPAYKIWLHKVLLGPPGVGKTTLARIMAQLEHSLALRKKGHLVETDKSGLIAGYAGQTLGKTTEVIDQAMDGTLLIDEAYALGQSKDDGYAKDATAVIVKRMWDDKERLTVTFAGYEKETEEFVNSNPGMRSRIGMWLRLKPFSSGELIDIFKLNLDKQVTRYDANFLGAASMLLEATREREGNKFGNARTVEKMVNDLNFKNSARLKDQNLMMDEKAHKSPPFVEDLPFEEVAGISFEELPDLSEFRWIGEDGKELRIAELSLDHEFPQMSPASIELIRNALKRQAESKA